MTDKKTKKGLGRGLGAFFEDELIGNNILGEEKNVEKNEESVKIIKIRDIEPNPDQPRKNFEKEKLEALAQSIEEHGIIQPIVVKKRQDGMYEIVAGERRWRAAKLAGLKEVPCIEKEYSGKAIMEIALVENLQREDLNPIEEAEGYKKLMDTFGLKQEDVALRIGKSRSAIANAIRLNNLSEKVKKLVIENKISQGHARALLAVDDAKQQTVLAEKIINEGLNVRQTEKMISSFLKGALSKKEKKSDINMEIYFKGLEEKLSNGLGAKVKIKNGKNKGSIEITYHSSEELEGIIEKIRF